MENVKIEGLPIFPRLTEIGRILARERLLLICAEPGAGKTTLVPWHLLSQPFMQGRIALLQPRRIAARAAAERIAALLGQRLGETVGLRTRLETVISDRTRLEVMTEGVLTRIIQADPALKAYDLVIFDEFHERSLQADIALALVWDSRKSLRSDLSLLFMSATAPAAEVRAVFGEIPFVSVPGRTFPVETLYRPPLPAETPWHGAARLAREALSLPEGNGDILVFLPGFAEIRRTQKELSGRTAGRAVLVLHGRLPVHEQRLALAPHIGSGRIILSTNVAETSLTIPGVRAVVDTGLERRVRFHPRTGMDHWETVEISAASAEQRRGRAGRLGPGICLRWWRETDVRRPFSPPAILEADLAPLLLETALWGAPSPFSLTWLTPPPAGAVNQADEVLLSLGLIDEKGRITPLGRKAAGLGLPPRLGRMVIEAAGQGLLPTAALVAAMLMEGDGRGETAVNFRDRLEELTLRQTPGTSGRQVAREAGRIIHVVTGKNSGLKGADIDADAAGRLLLAAYPDRLAQREAGGLPGETGRFVLTGGRAVTVEGSLATAEFLVAAELDGGRTARLFCGAPLSRQELEKASAGRIEHCLTVAWEGWTPRFRRQERLGRIILADQPTAPPGSFDLRKAVRLRLAKSGLEDLPWDGASGRLLARCRFVSSHGNCPPWPDFSPGGLLQDLEQWLFPFGTWSGGPVFTAESLLAALWARLGPGNRRLLDELAPERWTFPSGVKRRIEYREGEIPVLAAPIQDFYGCTKTPCLCGLPLVLKLLSPAGRPVQITRDLEGFWQRSYAEVKKELRGRYPRHLWPEDPLVLPTAGPRARSFRQPR